MYLKGENMSEGTGNLCSYFPCLHLARREMTPKAEYNDVFLEQLLASSRFWNNLKGQFGLSIWSTLVGIWDVVLKWGEPFCLVRMRQIWVSGRQPGTPSKAWVRARGRDAKKEPSRTQSSWSLHKQGRQPSPQICPSRRSLSQSCCVIPSDWAGHAALENVWSCTKKWQTQEEEHRRKNY